MTPAQLQQLGVTPLRATTYAPIIAAAMQERGIATPAQQAHFVANVLHETGNLTCLVESLNYTAPALRITWPSHFTEALAEQYGRTAGHPADQRMVANIAYGSRMGNGPIHSDDGWNYRGRGGLQITGRDMYTRCGRALGLDLIAHPELLEQPEPAMRASAWFWTAGNPSGRSINPLADAGNVAAVCRAINGGENGLADRALRTRNACALLGAEVPA